MTIRNVDVTKGKGQVSIDPDTLPDQSFVQIVEAGLKVLINGGMTKLTKAEIPDEKMLQAEAMKIAGERVQALIDGKLKVAGRSKSASTKVPANVMTEARRIARQMVKDALREKGEKVSHYEATEITKYANECIEANPSIIETAALNLEERGKLKDISSIDVSAVHASEKLVKAAEAKKAKAKANAPLSAKQAGKVAPRANPVQHTPAH